MKRTSNSAFKTSDFKGTRAQKRALTRKMNSKYRFYIYEVELIGGDMIYVIALNSKHVKEILEAQPEPIEDEKIYWIHPLNPEHIKDVIIDATETEEETTLYEVFYNYTGNGSVICSTIQDTITENIEEKPL